MKSPFLFPKILLLLLLLLGVAVGKGWAQEKSDFPPRPNPLLPVNDYANVLSSTEAARLTQKIKEYDRTTSTTIIVVTIPSIGGYEVAQYATELGNRWQIGRQGKNNGIVILAAIGERKANISVGRGLEGALTDMTSGRIIRGEMVPQFKRGNYYEGFSRTVDAVIAATKGEYTADAEESADSGMSVGRLILMVVVILVLLRFFGGGGKGGGRYMSRRGGGMWIPPVIFGGGGFGGFGGGGRGGGGFGGGGSFGGGGGGSFGGGGASGSW